MKRIHSEETKRKISETLKGHKQHPFKVKSCGKAHSNCKICRPDVDYSRPKQIKSLQQVLDNPKTQRHRIKFRLIREGYVKNECGVCGIGPEWNGNPLVFHLDHINGDNKDNRIENFRLLCPNCHSQTETYTWKNYRRKKLERETGLEPVS